MDKSRIIASIGAGTAISLPFASQGRLFAAVFAAIFGAVAFHFLFNLAEGFSRLRLQKLGPTPEKVPIRPVLTLRVNANRLDVARVLECASSDLSKGAALKAVDESHASLEGVVPASIRNGYGELLAATISPDSDGWQLVTIASRPRPTPMAEVLVDFGRNFSNVQRLRNALVVAFGASAVREISLVDHPVD